MRNDFSSLREKMVEVQIAGRGIRDLKVLEAMRGVPRDAFVPEDLKGLAYADEPLPIGHGQTISQPYIVAYMTDVLELKGGESVLEIGTGSGYQTAVLASIAKEVRTVETVAALSEGAQGLLNSLGFTNIRFKIGDGTFGWEEFAPYDAIMVTAAPAAIPKALKEQLRIGGRMIVPVGAEDQQLVLIRREETSFPETRLLPVRFVPLVSVH
ncbi:MAG: protein-L-isoaspartate(D-aspartate) O-methyltransferase [Candidatus Aminicenantes bacterium]|nr:protein-L-isoaspartate(D-aspartate) O-methyltransferase [Candidatus Aminicenantes bacterium]